MASVNLKCPWCAESFGLDFSPPGQQVRCPRCGNLFTPTGSPSRQDLPEPVPPPLPADLDHVPPPPPHPNEIIRGNASSSDYHGLEPPVPHTPEPPVNPSGKSHSGAAHGAAKLDMMRTEQRPLRQLSPEERARRRIVRNIIMWCVGAGALVLIGAGLLALTRQR